MKLSKRNKLLVAGSIVALYLCYTFAISNTIIYYQKYKGQKEIINLNSSNPALYKKLHTKNRQLDTQLNNYLSRSDSSFQNELLSHLTALSEKHNLTILDFQEPHSALVNDLRVKSYRFSLQGSFNEILLALNTIENNPVLGYVQHISFLKKKNYKNNTYFLTAEVLLQRTETEKNKEPAGS